MEKKNYIVGVDIGSSNVVMIVGSRNADGTLSIEGIASRPTAGGVKSGHIDNVQSVGKAIRGAKEELEEELNIRINEAYAGISGTFIRCASYTDHVFIKDSANCITKEDVAALHDRMRNVIAADSEQIIDRIPQNYVVDDGREIDNPVGAFGIKLASTFLFVLCDKQQLKRVEMSFHNAGLRQPIAICANPAVLPNVLLSDEERDEGTAIIDLGGGTTDVSIVRGGRLRYIASIPIGASSIDTDLHSIGIAKNNAEQMKKRYGSAIAEMVSQETTIQVQMPGKAKKTPLPQFNLVAVIEARLKDIIEFAWKEIREAKFSSKIPCGIVLTGGSTLLENIDELFRRETGVDVRIAAARYGIDEESQFKIGTYAHSTAVAVLLFGAEHGYCEVTERVQIPNKPTVAVEPKVPKVPQRPEITETPTEPEKPHRPELPDEPEEQDEPQETVEPNAKPEEPEEPEDEPKTPKEGIFDKIAKAFNNFLSGSNDNELL